MPMLTSFRELLQRVPERLKTISPEAAGKKRTASHWSPKEELGHLLDSAANNHQRIVRGQLEDNPKMPSYDQNGWVTVHAYQHRDWEELIELWQALNLQLLSAAEAVPASAWARTLTVAGSEPLTLQFIFEDYVAHMLHHLQHVGIRVDDIQLPATN